MSTRRNLHPGLNIGQTDPGAHLEAEPVMFGFWIFLMSDLLLFALLLATYATLSLHGTAGGPTPRDVTDLASAGIETALLLLSSFTFGLASLALKYRHSRSRLLFWLGVTAVLGVLFLALEARDFARLVAADAVPQRSGFLSAHFTLLGFHALHVAAGLVWLAVAGVFASVIGAFYYLRIVYLMYFGEETKPLTGQMPLMHFGFLSAASAAMFFGLINLFGLQGPAAAAAAALVN